MFQIKPCARERHRFLEARDRTRRPLEVIHPVRQQTSSVRPPLQNDGALAKVGVFFNLVDSSLRRFRVLLVDRHGQVHLL